LEVATKPAFGRLDEIMQRMDFWRAAGPADACDRGGPVTKATMLTRSAGC
jgi:hypothetical protein